MIIDFHVHVFPDKIAQKAVSRLEKLAKSNAFTDGSLAQLKKSMREASVDISVLQPVATHENQVSTCNDFAIYLNENNTNLVSFGSMHPDFNDYKSELFRLKNHGILGIKLHPNYQKTYFDDIRYKRIIECANELGLIVLTHAGLDIGLPEPIYATPKNIKNLVHDVKPDKLVLAHMGSFHMWDEVLELLFDENVYLDTAFSLGYVNYFKDLPENERNLSMMSENFFKKMLNAFGDDRILFATDSPWCSQTEIVKIVQQMDIKNEQKDKILYKNAQKLLNL